MSNNNQGEKAMTYGLRHPRDNDHENIIARHEARNDLSEVKAEITASLGLHPRDFNGREFYLLTKERQRLIRVIEITREW